MIPSHFLKQRQGLPLEAKVVMSQQKIREFYDHFNGDVYVSFSGGKDSTVLLDIVRQIYPNVPAVFVDTGLEYPEIKEFVKSIDNVTWLKPKMPFNQVIEKYGYPVVSKKVARQIRDIQNPTGKNQASINLYLTGIKRDGTKTKWFKLAEKWKKLSMSDIRVSEKCCDIIKKEPIKIYEKQNKNHGIIGTMASDSMQREQAYLKTGCNHFKGRGISLPMAFWLEQDVWEYIKTRNLTYSKIYDMGLKRTGCMFCMFGVHLEKEPNRFQCMKKTHPKQYDYCMNKLGLNKILEFIKVKF